MHFLCTRRHLRQKIRPYLQGLGSRHPLPSAQHHGGESSCVCQPYSPPAGYDTESYSCPLTAGYSCRSCGSCSCTPTPGPAPTAAVPLSGHQSGRSYSLDRIAAVYHGVVDNVNQGRTHEEAFVIMQIKRRTFRTYRNIAEARLVDLHALDIV